MGINFASLFGFILRNLCVYAGKALISFPELIFFFCTSMFTCDVKRWVLLCFESDLFVAFLQTSKLLLQRSFQGFHVIHSYWLMYDSTFCLEVFKEFFYGFE